MTLGEELGEKYRMSGLDAALNHYADLKNEYYGRGAYDFGENGLNEFGYEILGNDDFEGAIAVFTLNTEAFPESGNVWDSLGEGYMKSGNKESAIKYYEKSLELNPNNQNARNMLEELRN